MCATLAKATRVCNRDGVLCFAARAFAGACFSHPLQRQSLSPGVLPGGPPCPPTPSLLPKRGAESLLLLGHVAGSPWPACSTSGVKEGPTKTQARMSRSQAAAHLQSPSLAARRLPSVPAQPLAAAIAAADRRNCPWPSPASVQQQELASMAPQQPALVAGDAPWAAAQGALWAAAQGALWAAVPAASWHAAPACSFCWAPALALPWPAAVALPLPSPAASSA